MNLLRTSGRAPVPVEASFVRHLTEADLDLLNEPRESKPSVIKRLSERHHSLARCIAGGMKEWQAAYACGYDLARVSVLKGDPAFQELVRHYRVDVDLKYGAVHEQIAGVTVDALDLIRDRLEDVGDKVPLKELREIAQMGLDRSGHGPSSKQEVNVNVNLADRLAEARKRIAARTIDITPTKE